MDKRKQALAEMKWDLGVNDVRIAIQADPKLNRYDSRRHTLLLAVCQAPSPDMLLTQLVNQTSIARLLETGQGGPMMLSGFNRFVISPGQKDELKMDRAQGAQYVGIVAGYYSLDPAGVARLFSIPVVMQTHGWFFKSYTATIQPLDIELNLGAVEIEKAVREKPAVKGELLTVPGESDGVIPINTAGISNATAVSAPTVVAVPSAAPATAK